MSQDIRDFVPLSCELLGLGEPTHLEPAFAYTRNELFVQLVDRGFRSIALESDRVAALAVNSFVQEGVGALDAVMKEGFSHTFGDLDTNRQLISWMRDYNENRPAAEQVAFHGFDASLETMSAPSPRTYLEHARDYLGLDLDLTDLGDDSQWSRTEALMDPAMSPGATAPADKLRSIADDMLTSLYVQAPELIAATSHTRWLEARTYLTAGLGLLRYHKQAAQDLEMTPRWTLMCATRDALMAQNLLDIRDIESQRGPTLVFAHNLHLQRNRSTMQMGPMELNWSSAGAIISSLLGERYTFIATSLGRSETIDLQAPETDTFEGHLQSQIPTWALTPAAAVPSARTRTDTNPMQGYFPLEQALLDTTDAILHINTGTPRPPQA
jgi:erythromycin esterase-like protein